MQVDESRLMDETAERADATELFTQYSAGVYRYCLKRLGSREEAEDALQVTYLNAWRSLKSGFEPRHPRPWLFQIAGNVCASALRSKLGGTRLELRDPNALDELAGVDDRGSEELLGLSEALRELPSRQRRALVLRDWQGLSYNEIAAEMAVSDAAVETLLFRARNKVATALVASDWRRRLAPASRALLFWPFGFLRTKTAATTGAEHLKIGLAIAGGTVVPLVAFGLFQALLSDPAQATQGTRGPVVSPLESPRPAAMWLQEGPLLHLSLPAAGTSNADGRPQANRRRHHASPNAAANVVRPSSTTSSNSGTTHEAKVVLCHGTHSQVRPAVTISVSTHALAGLDQDSPGACS